MEINGINRPIFVVGASRSGTELMRSILNQHPSVSISTETHYFDDLRVKLKGHEQRGLTEQEAYRCEVYFRTAMHRRYGHRSEPANLSLSQQALCGTAAMIELVPTHSSKRFVASMPNRTEQIGGGKKHRVTFSAYQRSCAPILESQIICMIKDPRAVIASYRDWKQFSGTDIEKEPERKEPLQEEERRVRRSYNILIACLLWSGSIWAALEGKKRFTSEHVFIQRYEDLISDPESALKLLTAWLSLDPHPAMLDVPLTIVLSHPLDAPLDFRDSSLIGGGRSLASMRFLRHPNQLRTPYELWALRARPHRHPSWPTSMGILEATKRDNECCRCQSLSHWCSWPVPLPYLHKHGCFRDHHVDEHESESDSTGVEARVLRLAL